MTCVHRNIEAALDRWTECHWHIHQMEAYYHEPDLFRYSLNSYLRAVKEIPQILKMELQNHSSFKSTFKPQIDELRADALFDRLAKHRDFIVHQGMLEILSGGMVGTTEGRGFKIGVGFNVAPFESSDEAYERYKNACRSNKVFRGAFGPDCDSSPCIRREWKLPEFPDRDVLEVAVSAWGKAGEAISCILVSLGGEPIDVSFSCWHDPERVKMKVFSQKEFFESVDGRA